MYIFENVTWVRFFETVYTNFTPVNGAGHPANIGYVLGHV